MSSGWFKRMVEQVLPGPLNSSLRVDGAGQDTGDPNIGNALADFVVDNNFAAGLSVRRAGSGAHLAYFVSPLIVFAQLSDGVNFGGYQLVNGVFGLYGNKVDVQGAGVFVEKYALASGDGALSPRNGVISINKGSVAVLTLAAPTVALDDGARLDIIALTAHAHTVTQAAPGFNGGGAASDLATFGGAIGDNISLIASNGIWLVKSTRNVTLS